MAAGPVSLSASRRCSDANVSRREQREPLAYILGEWGFRRLTLKTDPRALIPRPETEIVVERALDHIRDVDFARQSKIGASIDAMKNRYETWLSEMAAIETSQKP